MSCWWNVFCVDCADEQPLLEAGEGLASVLVKHADAIAGLAPLLAESVCQIYDLGLRREYDRVDAKWFAQHRGHYLVPRNEYGGFKPGEVGGPPPPR